MLVVAANSPVKSLAVSEYWGMTVEEEMKVDGIVSWYYLVIKAN
jgi:hypothetical protein